MAEPSTAAEHEDAAREWIAKSGLSGDRDMERAAWERWKTIHAPEIDELQRASSAALGRITPFPRFRAQTLEEWQTVCFKRAAYHLEAARLLIRLADLHK
jgi:hypothetical protein